MRALTCVLCAALQAPAMGQPEIIRGGVDAASQTSASRVQMIVGRTAPQERRYSHGEGAAGPLASGAASRTHAGGPARVDTASSREHQQGEPPTSGYARGGDGGRIQILEQELAREGEQLAEKQRLLSAPATSTDPLVTALRDRLQREVMDHGRNIAALQRELGRTVAGSE